MLLMEIFGFGKEDSAKLIKQLNKLFKQWRGHLHLAHTTLGHVEKNEAYQNAWAKFETLKKTASPRNRGHERVART